MSRYSDEQVRALEFCTYCPRLCHFACPSAHGDGSEASTAWGLMSLANHVRKGELAPDNHLTSQLYHCAACGRCTDFCVHGNDVPSLIRLAREAATDACGIPAPVRETIDALCPPASDSAAPEHHPAVLALGCESRAALSDDAIDRLRLLLSALLNVDVTLAEQLNVRCCGDLATRGGDGVRAESVRHTTRHALMNAGLVLSDCAGYGEVCDGEVVSLYDELARHSEKLRAHCGDQPRVRMVLHGACHSRRSLNSEAAERAILDAIGIDVVDLPAISGNPDCCGAEAMYTASTSGGAARAAQALEVPVALPLVSSGVRCAAHLTEARGEPVVSLLELVAERYGEVSPTTRAGASRRTIEGARG